jgi:hypothetical protein
MQRALQLRARSSRTPHEVVARSSFLVAGTGVDPVTPRFSGVCSAD